jgi:hypothetical protein
MARGWESKSVESQMEQAESKAKARTSRPARTDQQLRIERERESLQMSRKRVLHDIEAATHARYRAQLEAALGYLERRLKELGGE